MTDIPSPQPAPLVIVFPRGQLAETDKLTLREAGVIAIEADDPKAVQQLQLAHPLNCQALTGDAIVRAALSAIAGQSCETPTGQITTAGRASHSFVTLLSNSLDD